MSYVLIYEDKLHRAFAGTYIAASVCAASVVIILCDPKFSFHQCERSLSGHYATSLYDYFEHSFYSVHNKPLTLKFSK